MDDFDFKVADRYYISVLQASVSLYGCGKAKLFFLDLQDIRLNKKRIVILVNAYLKVQR